MNAPDIGYNFLSNARTRFHFEAMLKLLHSRDSSWLHLSISLTSDLASITAHIEESCLETKS
ncbi:hypothetical protein NQZ68_036303 [Dissostichus eleginoides]|nr:hypothetical protein NQZ68_036303 [Dissostichus eleginoides]